LGIPFSLELLLLLCELLLNLEKRDFEETIKTFLVDFRHDPLYDNVNLLFFVSLLHLEFIYHKVLLLFIEILSLLIIKNALSGLYLTIREN